MKDKDEIIDLFKTVGIDPDDSISLAEGNIEIEPAYGLTPADFIRFAELDLEQKDDRSLVNSLSNAKRAIDCQTDMIIDALRLSVKQLKLSKFKILEEIGVLTPRILHKIRKARNLLEHEYCLPEVGFVEDAVDVATLYEATSRRVFDLFPELVHIANDSCESGTHGNLFCSEIYVLFTEDGFRLEGHKDNKKVGCRVLVTPKSDLYFPLTKLYVTAHLKTGKDKALSDFYRHIGLKREL